MAQPADELQAARQAKLDRIAADFPSWHAWRDPDGWHGRHPRVRAALCLPDFWQLRVHMRLEEEAGR